MHKQCRRFPGTRKQSNRRCKSPNVVENEVFEAERGGGVGAMCLSTFLNLRRLPGGGILKEFLGGDLPLGPWNS